MDIYGTGRILPELVGVAVEIDIPSPGEKSYLDYKKKQKKVFN